MNICGVKNAFKLKHERGWDTLYVMVDVHGVIVPSTYVTAGVSHLQPLKFITEDCIHVLRWFSRRKDIKLILWTSSYTFEIEQLLKWLETYNIVFDYVNSNPECKATRYADFTHKPYFNILIDDKAGFEPETDWNAIKQELVALGEWTQPEKLNM